MYNLKLFWIFSDRDFSRSDFFLFVLYHFEKFPQPFFIVVGILILLFLLYYGRYTDILLGLLRSVYWKQYFQFRAYF